LFVYNFDMEIMSARDLSKYLKVNEKKIYKLVQEGKLPTMKIGGKVTFAKELIDKWILASTGGAEHLLLAGSDDAFLRNIIDAYNALHEKLVFYAPVGSINGLIALRENKATMSCVHIIDGTIQNNYLSYVDKYLGQDAYVVISLYLREQGIMVRKGNPKGIKSLQHIAAKGATFINRNQGSGTRLLLDFLLNEAGVDPISIKGYEQEADSHLQVGLSVLGGETDAGFGIRYVANMLGLDFIFLFQERFDLVVSKDFYPNAQVKAFLSFFEQASRSHNANDYVGYDTKGAGQIVTPRSEERSTERVRIAK
jgi:putative molybdopterin biosynthesis protein